MIWADLETSLEQEPLFLVGKPDGARHLSELARVKTFRDLLRNCGKGVHAYAIPNAGKRGYAAQRKAKAEGMVAGVFDLCITWPRGGVAWIEFKGYDARGTAGKLSQSQIDWGNLHFLMGHNVSCFFCPTAAVQWLREQGAPILQIK